MPCHSCWDSCARRAGLPLCGRQWCYIRRCRAAARWPKTHWPPSAPWSAKAASGWNRPKVFFSSARLILLRACGHDRRVDVHRDQLAVRTLRGHPRQQPRPLAGRGAGSPDCFQRGRRVRGRAATSRVTTGSEATRPEQPRLSLQYCDIGQAVPAQRQGHREIGNDLRAPPGRPPPLQRRRNVPAQALWPAVSASAAPRRRGTQIPVPPADTAILACGPVVFTRKVPFELAWIGLWTSPILPAQRNFLIQTIKPGPPGESLRLGLP
jgi:hypothetical protein